jgi:hypothetical protein
VAVLNQAQSCDASLEWAGRGRYEADSILTALCTTACTASLSTWLKRATGACTTRFIDPQGNAILPAYWVESVLENYSVLCLKNGYNSDVHSTINPFGLTYCSDKFCNAVVRDAAGIDPENQAQTKSARRFHDDESCESVVTPAIVPSVTCDDCFLKQIQTRLQMPLQSNTDLAKTFTSLTSACGKAGFAATPIASSTAWITS